MLTWYSSLLSMILLQTDGHWQKKSIQREQSSHCYFNVDPIITLPKRSPILSNDARPLAVGQGGQILKNESITIPMDGLVIQSVIGKWLGPLNQWEPHIKTIRDRGYNMLHFTPLQQRGQSNSPYSLFNQLSFDDSLFSTSKKLKDDEKE